MVHPAIAPCRQPDHQSTDWLRDGVAGLPAAIAIREGGGAAGGCRPPDVLEDC